MENNPNPFYADKIPEKVEDQLRQWATSRVKTVASLSGKPRQKDDESDDKYQARLRTWEAGRAADMEILKSMKDSKIFKDAIREYRRSPTAQNLLLGKGRPQSGRNVRERRKRWNEKRAAVLEFFREF